MSKANWFTLEEEDPLEDYGTRPSNRSVKEKLSKGFVLVDKPFGPTSNQVTSWVQKILDRKKAGHFGTLDPNATGVLPIGIDRGTKIQKVVSDSDKEYVFEAELEDDQDKQKIETRLRSFHGPNRQVPPEKSAVKREPRTREVYEIELLEKKGNRILGRVSCESGFYVRTLIDQLGEKLDTAAEMVDLRRTRVNGFGEDETWKLQEIADHYHFWNQNEENKLNKIIRPIEAAVKDLPKIVVKNSAVNAVANGSNLGTAGIAKLQDGISEGDTVALMTSKGELVALATAGMSSQHMYEDEGEAADLDSVYMDPSEYPRRWGQ